MKLNLLVAVAFKWMYIYVGLDPILILPEVSMAGSVGLIGAAVIVVALLAIYVPTVYIRKTNKLIALLERIEANTRK